MMSTRAGSRKSKTAITDDNINNRLREAAINTKHLNSIKGSPEFHSVFKNCAFLLDEDEEVEYERDSSKWPVKAVELMTYHRLRLNSAFHSPKYTKNKLWDTISEYLKEANFNFDGKECHLKFRNMLATYKKNVEKVNVYGEECIKWKWFHAFHTILQFKPQNGNEQQPGSGNETVEKEEEPERGEEDEEIQVEHDSGIQVNARSASEPPETPDSEFRKWSRSAVNLLLMLRHQFADIFNDPTSHKVKCWRKIAKILRESGYDVSDRDCIVKWHNLINTYRSNLRKSQNEHIRWEWFDLMSKILNQQMESEGAGLGALTTIHTFPKAGSIDSIANTGGHYRKDQSEQHQFDRQNDHRYDQQHSNIINIPSELDDDKISITSDTSDLFLDDSISLEDIFNDEKTIQDRYARKVKRYQRSYWKEKLKILKAAEHRRKREWTERKQIELQKINLKKQKLKMYHRLNRTLEQLASNGTLRDLIANDRLAK